MMNEYFKATLDYSIGNAYNYRMGSKIPTKIEYRRRHCGEWEQKTIKADMTNLQLHNVMYLIKRGYTIEDIMTEVNKEYEVVHE